MNLARSGATILLVTVFLQSSQHHADAFQPARREFQQRLHTLLRTQLRASVSSPDAHSVAGDFSLDDFEGNARYDLDDLDATTEDSVIDEKFVPATEFLKMVEQTPAGDLKDAELKLLRKVLSSLTFKDEGPDVSLPNIAERLLFRWVEEWQERSCTIEPTTEEFVVVMRAWEAQIGSDPQTRSTQVLPSPVERVTSLLAMLEDLYTASHVASLQPNADVFRVVLRTMAASREREIDRRAERLFLAMQADYGVEPDASMYESLIHVLAKSRNSGAANRAERLLREAVTRLSPDSTASCRLGIDSFNVVLTAWAKSGMEYGPERAEKLVVFMEEVGVQPSVSSFTNLIDAYSQTNTWDGASRCESIFNRVLDLFLVDGDGSFEPTVVSWTVVMSAWARLAKRNFTGAGERADRLLRRMEALHADGSIHFGPDHIVYVTCMNANAFSKTVEGLNRAKEILDEMNERYMDGDDSFKPTARSIRVLIDCWIRSSLRDKMDGAERILVDYKDHLDALGPPNDPPEVLDVVKEIYKSMIFGWSQNGDPILAQQYLQEMADKGLEPDPFCFDRVIEANTLVNDPNALQRSYATFQLMEACRVKGDVFPNERVYTSFIRAMIKARVPGLARKSASILNRMRDLHQEGSNKSIKPTVFTYNAVLLACAESTYSADDAEQSLKEALKVAVTIFNELRSDRADQPDHVTFGNMLRCSNLLPLGPQKDALIASVFQLCCKRGFVNQFVLRDLRLVSPDALWQELLGCTSSNDKEVSLEQLPPSWRRNSNSKPTKKERPSAPSRRRDPFYGNSY